jgi:hypothetical protein
MFLITFFKLLFLKSYVMSKGLWQTLFPLSSLAWATCGGVTIIESSSGTRQGDPLEGPLFILAHYQTLLKTIA